MTLHTASARIISVVPESAPFNAAERALLNQFFTAAFALDQPAPGAASSIAVAANPFGDGDTGDAPWHDPALEIDARVSIDRDD